MHRATWSDSVLRCIAGEHDNDWWHDIDAIVCSSEHHDEWDHDADHDQPILACASTDDCHLSTAQ